MLWASAGSGGCVVGARDVVVPDGKQASVVVGSAALPAPLSGVARHPWVALRERGAEAWERWEVMNGSTEPPLGVVHRSSISPIDDYGAGGGDVRLHAVLRGDVAEEAIACVREKAPEYPHRFVYRAWPGPNSNTFVDYLSRVCDLGVDLPAPSIGKDYRQWLFGVSTTGGGTGIAIESVVLGGKVGIKEGVELHVLGLAWGLDLWPPAIVLPVGPGRLGFDDR